jgi:predicted nucleotidyltransferase
VTVPSIKHIVAEIENVFKEHSLTYSSRWENAEEVVLFGSRAVGCEHIDSDYDILIIGQGKRLKKGRLDVICISPERSLRRSWLGSELANHIARFGIWLKGEGSWRSSVFVSEASVITKREHILVRLATLFARKKQLHGNYLLSALEPVVLDLYRLECLLKGEPVPPAPILWKKSISDEFELLKSLSLEDFLDRPGECMIERILEYADIHSSLQRIFCEYTRQPQINIY